MTCVKCGSGRVVAINAKCSDMCMVTYGDKQRDGYVPDDIGIGSGDYVDFNYCLQCGQIQDEFPKVASSIEDAVEAEIDEDDIEPDIEDESVADDNDDPDMPDEEEIE